MSQTDPFDITGKIALVTGASRGIGQAIAGLLASRGAHVIVSSRKLDDCKIVADEIRAAGGKADALACHVGRMEDISAAFDHIEKTYGRLDILVNNAAANPYYGHILDTDLVAYDKTVEEIGRALQQRRRRFIVGQDDWPCIRAHPAYWLRPLGKARDEFIVGQRRKIARVLRQVEDEHL